jgi:hypothetical protein
VMLMALPLELRSWGWSWLSIMLVYSLWAVLLTWILPKIFDRIAGPPISNKVEAMSAEPKPQLVAPLRRKSKACNVQRH